MFANNHISKWLLFDHQGVRDTQADVIIFRFSYLWDVTIVQKIKKNKKNRRGESTCD